MKCPVTSHPNERKSNKLLQRIKHLSSVARLTLLFLLMIVITGVVVGLCFARLQTNFRKSCSDSIDNAGNALDILIADMNLNAMSMLDSADFSTSKIVTKYGSFLAISRALNNYVTCTDLISNAFYVNKDIQTVYTVGKPYHFKDFSLFNRGYGITDEDYADFFLLDQRNFWIPAQVVEEGKPAVLTHVVTYTLHADRPEYALVIHVVTDKLQNLLNRYLPSPGSMIMLLDTDNRPLYLTGNPSGTEWLAALSDIGQVDTNVFTLQIEGQAYETFVKSSDKSALYYALAVPRTEAFGIAGIDQYLTFFLCLMGLLAFFFILMALRWSRKNRHLFPERVALQLYQGGYSDKKALWDDFRQVGIAKPEDFCQALLLKIARPADVAYDNDRRQMPVRLLDKLLAEATSVIALRCLVEDTLFVLLAGEKKNLQVCLQGLLLAKEQLEQIAEADVAIGIGTMAPFSDTARTINEAKVAISNRFVRGENAVIDFQMLNSPIGYLSYPSDRLSQYYDALLTRKEATVQASLAQLMKIITSGNNLFFATCLMYDIVNTTLKAIDEMNYSSTAFQNLPISNINHFTSIEDVKGILDALIADIVLVFHEGTLPPMPVATDERAQLLDKMKEHIQAHFLDADFSVKSLAASYHMSISNLSHFFKKMQNTNVSSYILELRVNKSKELMRKTDHTFQDIASACGYVNISTFLRQFKQSENMTPSQYRALYRKAGS